MSEVNVLSVARSGQGVSQVIWEGEATVRPCLELTSSPGAEHQWDRGPCKYRVVAQRGAFATSVTVERHAQDAMGGFAWVAESGIFVIASVLRHVVIENAGKGAGA